MTAKKLKELVAYVEKSMGPHDNVSIHLPGLADADLEALRKSFKIVERSFMGYVQFRKAKA